jgi:ornithine cyclodeaminase/alanine dehydrogenase-like protein (mu-crystallin family)
MAAQFAAQMSSELNLPVAASADLSQAALASDVIVTCTPARKYFLRQQDVRPGTFISAVGADSPGKQELQPQLLASSKVVVDILEQCAKVGELQHALGAKLIALEQVYGELGDLAAGRLPGRANDQEITIFDTTGSAIQDTAAAVAVYQKALATQAGQWINLFA